MAELFNMNNAKDNIQKVSEEIGKVSNTIGRISRAATGQVKERAGKTKQKVVELTASETDSYEEAVAKYNAAFVSMNDAGLTLLRQRERCVDLIANIEVLVSSVANTPKSFEKRLTEILFHKKEFLNVEELAQRELEEARKTAVSSGAGFAAGATVASMGPTAAIWVATTFGTASTGTAISTLSGAAASNAALAWLGGGAITAGGGGTASGTALLALAGPIGWTIAGATLLTSIVLFTKKKFENKAAKEEALTSVKQNTAHVRELGAELEHLLAKTASLRQQLMKLYWVCLQFFNADFLTLTSADQNQLAALVNNTNSVAVLLGKHITPDLEE